jgi:predicted RNase H-like HicB family nuclease
VLPAYLENVMLTAIYITGEDGDCYGSIPGFSGVCARGEGMSDCREALRNALEDWLLRGSRPAQLVA